MPLCPDIMPLRNVNCITQFVNSPCGVLPSMMKIGIKVKYLVTNNMLVLACSHTSSIHLPDFHFNFFQFFLKALNATFKVL